MFERNFADRQSMRLTGWNYASIGGYFITICTQNKKHFFGQIHNNEMKQSPIGEIVESEWIKTPVIRPDMNLRLGPYVVMPNHFHGIIDIRRNDFNWGNSSPSQFGPQSKNMASIIRGFKSAVTSKSRKFDTEFKWQSRFYDHIIRTEKDYDRIEDYIKNNVLNWRNDCFYN